MRLISRYRLVLGVAVSLAVGTMGTLTLGVDQASAQDINFRGQCPGLISVTIVAPTCNNTSGGDAQAAGGNGGNGGLFTIVSDVGNAEADASNLVIVHDITTGDATAPDVNVDAAGATRPVVVSVAGTFIDTGVDIFAPGGSPQAGTTGGNGIISDSSGGPGGNARANGGDGGDISGLLPLA
jgi:hypothetical protein